MRKAEAARLETERILREQQEAVQRRKAEMAKRDAEREAVKLQQVIPGRSAVWGMQHGPAQVTAVLGPSPDWPAPAPAPEPQAEERAAANAEAQRQAQARIAAAQEANSAIIQVRGKVHGWVEVGCCGRAGQAGNAEPAGLSAARLTCCPPPPSQRKRDEYEERQRHNEERRRAREEQRVAEEEERRAQEAAKEAQRRTAYEEAQRREAARIAEARGVGRAVRCGMRGGGCNSGGTSGAGSHPCAFDPARPPPAARRCCAGSGRRTRSLRTRLRSARPTTRGAPWSASCSCRTRQASWGVKAAHPR